MLRLTPG